MTTYSAKDGREFILRHPTENHAEGIIEYSKIMFASTDQTLTTLDEFTVNTTLESEKVWIDGFNKDPNAFLLIAEMNSQIVGLLFFSPHTKKKIAHTGEFGVSVHPDYKGQGIGRKLIEQLLSWAKRNNTIEKVLLNVMATNPHAIALYEDLGFVQDGRQKNAIKQLNGEYVDNIQMSISTK